VTAKATGGQLDKIGADILSAAMMLRFSLNQRATFRWVAQPGSELLLAATQNNGACLQTVSSTSTQAYEATILFQE
jgi:hypothetical protein